jgi:hypothetical protein
MLARHSIVRSGFFLLTVTKSNIVGMVTWDDRIKAVVLPYTKEELVTKYKDIFKVNKLVDQHQPKLFDNQAQLCQYYVGANSYFIFLNDYWLFSKSGVSFRKLSR